MKATAPQAPVSPGKNSGKAQGAKGLSSALVFSPNKAKNFSTLMSARLAALGTQKGLPAALENGHLLLLRTAALNLAHSDGKKIPLPIQTAQARQPEKQALAGAQVPTDKTDARKKTVRSHAAEALPAELAPSGPAPLPGAAKTANANKPEAAAAATPPADARSVTAHHAEPIVRVVDQRSKSKADDANTTRQVGTTAGAPGASDKDANVSFAQRLAPGDLPADAPQKPALAAPVTQTTLERLQDMTGSDLLRATNLVLKDGGGEIRMTLKPDSLGSVRVRMNLVDNVIEGKIIVDSSAAKQVVDGSIDALRRALTAEGFQTGSLQVSVGGQNTDTDARKDQEQQPQAIRRISAQGFEQNIPGVENLSLGDLLVNVFV